MIRWEGTALSNLLDAGLARILSSRFLHLSALFLGLRSVWLVCRSAMQLPSALSLEAALFSFPPWLGLLTALLCGLFLGGEQEDGALRSCILCGHPRNSVYLSGLLTCWAGTLVLWAAAAVPVLLLGLPLSAGFRHSLEGAALPLLGTLVLALAWTGIFTLADTWMPSRRSATVLSLLLALGLFLAGLRLNRMVNDPFIPDTSLRSLLSAAQVLCPGSQALLYASMEADRPLLLILSALLLLALATAAGLLLFRHADLK